MTVNSFHFTKAIDCPLLSLTVNAVRGLSVPFETWCAWRLWNIQTCVSFLTINHQRGNPCNTAEVHKKPLQNGWLGTWWIDCQRSWVSSGFTSDHILEIVPAGFFIRPGAHTISIFYWVPDGIEINSFYKWSYTSSIRMKFCTYQDSYNILL